MISPSSLCLWEDLRAPRYSGYWSNTRSSSGFRHHDWPCLFCATHCTDHPYTALVTYSCKCRLCRSSLLRLSIARWITLWCGPFMDIYPSFLHVQHEMSNHSVLALCLRLSPWCFGVPADVDVAAKTWLIHPSNYWSSYTHPGDTFDMRPCFLASLIWRLYSRGNFTFLQISLSLPWYVKRPWYRVRPTLSIAFTAISALSMNCSGVSCGLHT